MTRNQHAPIRWVFGSFLASALLMTAAYAKDQASPEVAPPAKAKAFEDSSYTDTNRFFRWTRGGRDPSLPSPFSGIFIEAAGGYSWNNANASHVNTFVGINNGANPVYASNSVDGEKQTPAIGRFSLGLGYTLPYNTNLTIVGSYSTDQKLTPTMQLKNVFDARFQPGYYIVPAHMLVYASVGYAWARLSDSMAGLQAVDWSNSVDANGNPACCEGDHNMPFRIFSPQSLTPFGLVDDKVKLGGLVLGGGLKFSPIGRFYLGMDYSYIKYRNKTFTGSTLVDNITGYPAQTLYWSRTIEPRSSTVLLTMGYYFF